MRKIVPQIETAEKERFQVSKFKLGFFPAANILDFRYEAKNSKLVLKNIATGETSQGITPFHFFNNINFHH